MADCVNAKGYKEGLVVGVRNVKPNRRQTMPVAGVAYCEWNSRVVTDIIRFMKAKSTPGGVIVPGFRYKGAQSLGFSAAVGFR
jgi:hypothetical protein